MVYLQILAVSVALRTSGLKLPAPSPGCIAAPANQKRCPRSLGRLQLVKNVRTKEMLSPCGIPKQPLLSHCVHRSAFLYLLRL